MAERSWFDDAGLGLFIHYGHYAAAGWDASWPMVGGIPSLELAGPTEVATYHANAADFRPAPGAAEGWIAAGAAAGARYAVLTTRHHDGFSLWPSRAPGAFSVADVGLQRDLVREYVEACRAHGLRVGFYYSLSDWKHPDYPPFEEHHKPYAWGRSTTPTPEQTGRFQSYLKAQLTELLGDYGRIDVLWFDGGWERTPEQWDAAGLETLIRRLQPDILLNDRLPGVRGYATPEQAAPSDAPEGRWETCLTMNHSWGFNAQDDRYKSAAGLVHALCEAAGRGGNLLLNIGPMGDGTIPPPQAARLAALGAWMARHADAVRGADAGDDPWRFYGPTTRRGDRIYAFLLMRPTERVAVRNVPIRRVRSVRLLGDGQPLAWSPRAPVAEALFSRDPFGEIRVALPEDRLDPHASVIEVEIAPLDAARA
jgi:alpha-L-fucosidase